MQLTPEEMLLSSNQVMNVCCLLLWVKYIVSKTIHKPLRLMNILVHIITK